MTTHHNPAGTSAARTPEETVPPELCANCDQHCGSHEQLVDSYRRQDLATAAVRETLDRFIRSSAEANDRLRDQILTLATQTAEAHARLPPPGLPHPLGRADDYEEKVALTLSRKDFWKLTMLAGILLTLMVGLALVAGREGLAIWKPVAAKIPGVVP